MESYKFKSINTDIVYIEIFLRDFCILTIGRSNINNSAINVIKIDIDMNIYDSVTIKKRNKII